MNDNALVDITDLGNDLAIIHPTIAKNIEAILSDLAQGQTIKNTREKYGILESQWRSSTLKSSILGRLIAQARAIGYDELADSLLEIPDTYSDVQRASLKSSNIKFILSKRKPEIYGDRVDINVKGSIDLVGAIKEAKNRIMRPTHDIETTATEINPIDPITYSPCATDEETDAQEIDPFS